MIASTKSHQPQTIDHLQDSMINIVYNVCTIFTMPVEMALRPFHGTRYFSPIAVAFSAMMMMLLPLFFGFAGAVSGMIPFVRIPVSTGLIGMWGLSKLFFLGCAIHGYRKWKLMVHPERERFSKFEGPPLFFFTWIPGATFWKIRIVYEPLFLIALSAALPNFFILEPGAANFLLISAIFLAMKQHTAWLMGCDFVRTVLDSKNMGPVIASMVENRETEDDLASLHLASFPKDLDPGIRKAAVDHIARVFTGEESR